MLLLLFSVLLLNLDVCWVLVWYRILCRLWFLFQVCIGRQYGICRVSFQLILLFFCVVVCVVVFMFFGRFFSCVLFLMISDQVLVVLSMFCENFVDSVDSFFLIVVKCCCVLGVSLVLFRWKLCRVLFSILCWVLLKCVVFGLVVSVWYWW